MAYKLNKTDGTLLVDLIDGTIDTNRSLSLDTGSAHFDDGIKKVINDETVISGSTFSSPSQGTVRATINGANTDVDITSRQETMNRNLFIAII